MVVKMDLKKAVGNQERVLFQENVRLGKGNLTCKLEVTIFTNNSLKIDTCDEGWLEGIDDG